MLKNCKSFIKKMNLELRAVSCEPWVMRSRRLAMQQSLCPEEKVFPSRWKSSSQVLERISQGLKHTSQALGYTFQALGRKLLRGEKNFFIAREKLLWAVGYELSFVHIYLGLMIYTSLKRFLSILLIPHANFISRRSHESHEVGCIAEGSQLVGCAECYHTGGTREFTMRVSWDSWDLRENKKEFVCKDLILSRG